MQDFLEYINTLLESIVSDFNGDASSFLGPAKLIAGLGALIGVYMVYKKAVTDGEGINMNEIWRMSALALGIAFYGTFISLINAPLKLMSESIKSVAISSSEATDDFFDSYSFEDMGRIDHQFQESDKEEAQLNALINKGEVALGLTETEEEDSTLGSAIKSYFSGPSIGDKIQLYMMEAVYNIFHFLGVMAIIVLNVIRSFFLIVLIYFGIFVMAFSMYPGLQNSFFQWLQKYINVYLWLPISYILQGMISKMFTYFRADYVGLIPSSQTESLNAMNNGIVAIIGVCSIVAFATVPTMSAWLINASTTAAGSKLKQKASQGMQQAQKGASALGKGGAGAATGGASLAASAGVSAIKSK